MRRGYAVIDPLGTSSQRRGPADVMIVSVVPGIRLGSGNPVPVLDLVWLRTFLEVARTGGFSRAARNLGLGQATVSQHVRKLEDTVGRRLLDRDSHTVALTGDGEAIVGFARTILGHERQALDYFAVDHTSGRVRVGVSEDLMQHGWFAGIAQRFRQRYPRVDLNIAAGLSAPLAHRLAHGELELAVVKTSQPAVPRHVLWRDALTWVAAPDFRPDPREPLPLVTYPEPSITRERAFAALRRTSRAWRVSCTVDRLSALCTTVRAGAGVAVLADSVIPDGLVRLTDALPELDGVDFVLRSRATVRGTPTAALAELITRAASERRPTAH